MGLRSQSYPFIIGGQKAMHNGEMAKDIKKQTRTGIFQASGKEASKAQTQRVPGSKRISGAKRNAGKENDADRLYYERIIGKSADPRDVRKKRERFRELRRRAARNLMAARQIVKSYVKGRDVKKIEGEDCLGNMYENPFLRVGTKIGSSKKGLDFPEAFLLFTGYKMGNGFHTEARATAKKAGMDFIKGILSITPEKIAALKDTDAPDIESKEFWHNRFLLRSGLNTRLIMEALRNWNIPLTHEQYAHVIAFGKVAKRLITGASDESEGKTSDPLKLFEAEKRKAMYQARTMAVNKEMMAIKEYFPNAGEKEARMRLFVKNTLRSGDLSVSEEQLNRWRKHFGAFSGGAADVASFKRLLRPLDYDVNGSLTEEGEKNLSLNRAETDDYISEDAERRDSFLRKIGKELASIDIEEEMVTFDYLKENHERLYRILQLCQGFKNIETEYPDFFESDALTQKERDRIRKNIVDSKVIRNMATAHGLFFGSFGADTRSPDGEVSFPANCKTREDKEKWGRDFAAECVNKARMIYEDTSENGVAGAALAWKKRCALYKKKGKADEIRRASVLWAKTKAALSKAGREEILLTAVKEMIPDDAHKAQTTEKINNRIAELRSHKKVLKAKLYLAEELKRYVYEEEASLSDEARRLFEEEGKDTVIHGGSDSEAVTREKKGISNAGSGDEVNTDKRDGK